MADKTTQPTAPAKAIKGKGKAQGPIHKADIVAGRGAVAHKKNTSAFDALSDKEQIFVLEYLSSYNATKSVLKAGYSPNGARVQACRMLAKPNICNVLEEEQAKRSKELRMDASRILQEEAVIALFDPQDAFRSDTGELIPPNELPEHIRRNLVGVEMKKNVSEFDGETTTTYEFKYKFNDKGKSLERVARQMGLFIDKTELTGRDGTPLSSGVLLVPGVAGETDWLSRASEQQAKLVKMMDDDGKLG